MNADFVGPRSASFVNMGIGRVHLTTAATDGDDLVTKGYVDALVVVDNVTEGNFTYTFSGMQDAVSKSVPMHYYRVGNLVSMVSSGTGMNFVGDGKRLEGADTTPSTVLPMGIKGLVSLDLIVVGGTGVEAHMADIYLDDNKVIIYRDGTLTFVSGTEYTIRNINIDYAL